MAHTQQLPGTTCSCCKWSNLRDHQSACFTCAYLATSNTAGTNNYIRVKIWYRSINFSLSLKKGDLSLGKGIYWSVYGVCYIRFLNLYPATSCSTRGVSGELLGLLWGVLSLRITASCCVQEWWTAPIKAVFRAFLGFDMFLCLQELNTMQPFLLHFFQKQFKAYTHSYEALTSESLRCLNPVTHGINCCCTTEVAEVVNTA